MSIEKTESEDVVVTDLLTSSDGAYAKTVVDGKITSYEKESGDTDGPFAFACLAQKNGADAGADEARTLPPVKIHRRRRQRCGRIRRYRRARGIRRRSGDSDFSGDHYGRESFQQPSGGEFRFLYELSRKSLRGR